MKKTSKITAIVLVTVFCIWLCACGEVHEPEISVDGSTAATENTIVIPSETTVTLPPSETTSAATEETAAESTTETTQRTSETTTDDPSETAESLFDEFGNPTPLFKAKWTATMYANGIVADVVYGPGDDYKSAFAKIADMESAEALTVSLMRECQLALLMCEGEISMLEARNQFGNVREENGNIVCNVTVNPVVTVNGVEKSVMYRTLKLTLVPEGDEYLIAKAERVIRDSPIDILLFDVTNRTTFSELNVSCETSSGTEEEAVACEFISLWVEDLVLGTDNDFEKITSQYYKTDNHLDSMFAATGFYRGESFSGRPDVSITAKTVSLEEKQAVVEVTVESGIVATNSAGRDYERPTDGVFAITLGRSNASDWKWKVADAEVVEGDPIIAEFAALMDAWRAYFNSLPPTLY